MSNGTKDVRVFQFEASRLSWGDKESGISRGTTSSMSSIGVTENSTGGEGRKDIRFPILPFWIRFIRDAVVCGNENGGAVAFGSVT